MPSAPYTRRAVRLGVFAALAAAMVAVQRTSVPSQFTAISQAVVQAEQTPTHGVLRILLPDLSPFESGSAVLDLRLRNEGVADARVEVALNGFRQTSVTVRSKTTTRSTITLRRGAVRALAASDDGERAVELRAGAEGGWMLLALDLRNHYGGSVAGPIAAHVVPALPGDGPGRVEPLRRGVVAAFAVLAVLAAFAPGPRPRAIGLLTGTITTAAGLAVATCLLLPTVSLKGIVLSPGAFWLITAALFAPVLPTGLATVARWTWRFERAASLVAVVVLGVAQPVFDVVSNSPEFFAARNTATADVVITVALVCLAFPMALLGVERVLSRLHRRAGAAFLYLVLALLSAAALMPALKRLNLLFWPWDAVASGSFGLVLAALWFRTGSVRQFLAALGTLSLAAPVLFLLDSGVRGSLLAAESAATGPPLARTPPIVLVVFDEFPLVSLLDADRRIDRTRYPHFAAFADDAYWFRNAGTVSADTVWAVPAIVSGRYPTIPFAVPTLRYYPHNLFTVLAGRYDMHSFGRFQKLCPAGACRADGGEGRDSVQLLLSDLWFVWLHVVLPGPLADTLPPIAGDWLGFGGRGAGAARQTNQRPRNFRAIEFGRFLASMDGRPASLHFMHILLPHMPFEYVPSGRRYIAPDYQTRKERGKWLFEEVTQAYADTLHQRHLAQVGYVDRLVGDLLARLRDLDAYDAALVVLTADHGASYREGRARRAVTPNNAADIIQVPLFVKLPGQRQGRIVDGIAETVDILPTILHVLGARVPFEMDGRALVDEAAPGRTAGTFIYRGRANVVPRRVDDLAAHTTESARIREQRFGRGDPSAMYSRADMRHLLNKPRSEVPIRTPPGVQIAVLDPDRFAAVDPGRDPLPLYVRGTITGHGTEPLTLAILVNGTVAATTRSYEEEGATVFGSLIPEEALRPGRNSVEAVLVDEAVTDRTRPAATGSAR